MIWLKYPIFRIQQRQCCWKTLSLLLMCADAVQVSLAQMAIKIMMEWRGGVCFLKMCLVWTRCCSSFGLWLPLFQCSTWHPPLHRYSRWWCCPDRSSSPLLQHIVIQSLSLSFGPLTCMIFNFSVLILRPTLPGSAARSFVASCIFFEQGIIIQVTQMVLVHPGNAGIGSCLGTLCERVKGNEE